MKPGRFVKKFEVHYYEVDKFLKLTLPSLLNYLEDAAISHSAAAGLDVSELKSSGHGWILNRWFINFNEYPVLSQKLTVETWPSDFERCYGWREFFVKDTENRTIITASSLWIYLDIAKRRPARIPSDFGERYGLEPIKAINAQFSDLDFELTPEATLEFSVRRSDIDSNEHVNNTKYVEWLLEAIPEHITQNSLIKSFEINYKKETNYGAAVLSECSKECGTAGTCSYVHKITDKSTGQIHACARTTWEKLSDCLEEK
ncbi:MAG: thioesterase [Bacillota bacterium]|nr:thioesterase [Bacillota bacterium]